MKIIIGSDNFMDNNCIYHFMNTYKSLFVSIRSHSKEDKYIELLRIFERYIDIDITPKKIAMLKNEIDEVKNIEINEKEYFKRNLNVYGYSERIDKINNINYIDYLKNATQEMIKIIESKNYQRVHDFADAFHNFPQFLVSNLWSAENYYKIYIKIYNEDWKDSFFIEFERKNKFRVFIDKIIGRSNNLKRNNR